MEHDDNDECAVYEPGYELAVIGSRVPVTVEDVGVGDFVRDPACDAEGVWFEVYAAETMNGGDVHLYLLPASAAEVAQARRDACEGHETTRGAIGDTFYCDGRCI